MKILHTVEFYSPSVGGAQEVVKQLSEHLVLLGHDVTVATTKLDDRVDQKINGVKIVEFDISGNYALGYIGNDIEKYKNYLINSKFDAIMNYAAQVWTTDLLFEVIDKVKTKKFLIPCGFSGLYNPLYADYYRMIPTMLSKYSKTIYPSNNYRDINFARERGLSNIEIIPNGADEREFSNSHSLDKSDFLSKFNIPPENRLILTVGTHTGRKGHSECIKTFLRSPIRDASLIIIGNHLGNQGCRKSCSIKANISNFYNKITRNGKSIHLLSINRRDTINFYKVSDIFLFMSNIECSPLVLFECAASGLPFLAVGVGNSEEIINWTKSGILINSYQADDGSVYSNYADAISKLTTTLQNRPTLLKLGKKGKSSWKKKYTWEKLTAQYLNLYKG